MSRALTSVVTMGAVAGCLAFSAAGCARHRTAALPPVTEAPQPTQSVTIPPVETTKPADAAPPASQTQTQPPAPQPQTAQQTPPATTAPPVDAPPKTDAPKKITVEPPKPPAPQISQQLSPGDEAELQKQTNQYIGDAEKNLHRADGRDLNANQRDMVEKINGFLNQVHEAMKTSDWTRARNLSQKAFLLSVELANSLS
ncbi:MAG TPA: hypothetical protein VGR72_13860 [Candidatus Acidoferrales bacterium]|nr:hypothetical protein [Candidatus Acidoferrales bacterium]